MINNSRNKYINENVVLSYNILSISIYEQKNLHKDTCNILYLVKVYKKTSLKKVSQCIPLLS